MYQSFEETSEGARGPERLKALRGKMAEAGLDVFVVPRADVYQGEYVADCDARLAWLTGFTGSAGFAVVTDNLAALFVDGRYTLQAREQADDDAFIIVDFPENRLGPWLKARLGNGARVGFDPWLHTAGEIEDLTAELEPQGIELVPVDNPVDAIWTDRPESPRGKVIDHPVEFAGEDSPAKIRRIAAAVEVAGARAAVLTLPDSVSWLLNIRGSDIPRVPIVQAFAILFDDRRVSLFAAPSKFDDLGPDPAITIFPQNEFAVELAKLTGPVLLDKSSVPQAVRTILEDAGIAIAWGNDPCRLPKARKNKTELEGARAAHIRDGVAMVKFLHWLDEAAPSGRLTEIRVAERLEEFRRESNHLRDISFDSIAATGPNAALPHYRVNTRSNRPVVPGELLLVDSGGQYADGTTDITRTMATGPAEPEEKAAFTRVLQGMIAISRVRWPEGLAGRDLDALARFPLWTDGKDYDHGTGHGVGSYLSVHEGPQRLSRASGVPLEPGMILSNEPGYYREGHFGIRIENLVAVRKAPTLPHQDDRKWLDFETLTFVPIDLRLVVPELLSQPERDWLNAYHAEVRGKLAPQLEGDVAAWLEQATRPI